MNLDQNMFTQKELEVLARAYLDCRLSKLQEKELELLLASSDVSSPIIDEARDTMMATTMLEAAAPARPASRQAPVRRPWRWAAAAAVVLAAGVGLGLWRHAAGQAVGLDSAPCIVYVDGERLDPEAAAASAMATQSMCMAMMESTLNNAQALQAESIGIISKEFDVK